jgi:hypothetical protein
MAVPSMCTRQVEGVPSGRGARNVMSSPLRLNSEMNVLAESWLANESRNPLSAGALLQAIVASAAPASRC